MSTTEIYTLSLHDALPILVVDAGTATNHRLAPEQFLQEASRRGGAPRKSEIRRRVEDRKSTRLNSSHVSISYAVFCLKKKKNEGYPKRTSRNFLVQFPLLT